MGSKKYFDKQKQGQNSRGLSKKTVAQFAENVESQRYVEEYSRSKEQFIPDYDYGKPENFAKYGLATQYYADALSRIYNQYPYDGSKAEQLEFYNNFTPLEKYIFDERYPRTTGYALFSPSGWGTATALGNPATKEYITFYGNRADNIYKTGSEQLNNLKIDYSGSGNTIEFWLKKDGWTNPSSVTRYETIFDLRTTASVANAGHRQFEIFLDGNTSTTKTKINVLDFADGTTVGGKHAIINASLDTGLSNIADSKWHHYAIVVKADAASFITSSLYVDGRHTDSNITSSYGTGSFDNWAGSDDPGAQTAIATIGGHAAARIGAAGTYGTGWFKLTGSIDEFRFWKTARTGEDIGRNYFAPVYGGTNTDLVKYYHSSSVDYNKVDLGVYFKFNEGIIGDSATDATVLDYSGRVSNGTWTGYSSNSRSTSSAIVESGIAEFESLDPIMYGSHSDVTALTAELEVSGSEHDMINVASLYNSVPQWIREEDESGNELKKLTQVVGSYLDTLYGQISYFTNLKETSYITGSAKQSTTISKDLLRSQGFEVSDIFIDADILKEVFSRDSKRVYEEKLENVKNLVYKNIYNNLTFINKSKGTEKAFRNLFRCFGTDDELFKLNIYTSNAEHEIESGYETTSTKRRAIDFSGIKRIADREATVYQHPASGTGDFGYISGSYGDRDIPVTVEAQVLFPKFPKMGDYAAVDRLSESSLFGCHKVDHASDSDSTSFSGVDRDFMVSAVKVDEDRTYFKLSSTAGFFPTLTSSVFYDVYDNSVWNFAVRIRPEQYPWSSYLTASLTSSVELYGVNVDHGVIANEFLATGTMAMTGTTKSSVLFTTAMNKKFFVGAHRTNFNGTVLTKSDVRLLSFRYWGDYLTDSEITYHAKDPANFGRENPGQNSHVWEGNIGFLHVPNIDTLALHWDFDTISSSATDGTFVVDDITSGSTVANATGNQRYNVGNYSQTIKNSHPGKGYGFSESSSDVYTVEYIPTARITPPENLLSSKMIQILSTDDEALPRSSRPSKNFFAIEASMYDVISRKILNFFSSIDDFNNQIGAPIHKYRERYKGLEKLRQLFFERVSATPDVDKFVNLYKWLDSAVESVLVNLVPASAEVSEDVRTIIESHILERNKYRHKFATAKEFVKVDNNNKLRMVQEGEAESSYDYDQLYTAPMHPTYEPTAPNAAGINARAVVVHRPYYRSSIAPTYYEIRTPPTIGSDGYPTDESESAVWWKYKAERDRGIFSKASPTVSERSAANTRTQLWYNNKIAAISRSAMPVVDLEAEEQTYAAGVNDKRNHIWDYYRKIVNHVDTGTPMLSATINIDALSAVGQPFVHDQSLTGGLRKYPYKVQGIVQGTTTTLDSKFNENKLPFSVISSSVSGGYQGRFVANDTTYAVEDIHHDIYAPVYEIPMQGPFAEENAGGNMYRHGNLLVTQSAIAEPSGRREGYKVTYPNASMDPNSISVVSAVTPGESDRPRGDYTRGNISKAPVIIKNILPTSFFSTSKTGTTQQYVQIGNYVQDYEVVHLSGRSENNRYFRLVSGTQPTEKDSFIGPTAQPFKEFALPVRSTGSNKFVFVNKFSNRTGIEGESEAFLDWQSGEYSPYNAMPYQNLVVKTGLNTLWSRPTNRFGRDSHFINNQSFHKTHRNTVERPALAAQSSSLEVTNSASPVQVKDNMWVSHQIPQSEINYKWINDSFLFVRTGQGPGAWAPRVFNDSFAVNSSGEPKVTDIKYLPLLGFNHSTGSEAIMFVSASDVGFIGGDFWGYNKNYVDSTYPANADQVMGVDFVGMNVAIYEPITSSTNTLGFPQGIYPGALYYANYNKAFNLISDGFLKNRIAAEYDVNFTNALFLHRNGPYGWPTWKQIRTAEHPVVRHHINNNIYESKKTVYDNARKTYVTESSRIIQSPVTAKHKPIMHNLATSMIKYEFGNNKHYFAEVYDLAKNRIIDYHEDFNVYKKGLKNTMLYRSTRGKDWETVRYSEVVYPRDENVFKSIIRNKPNYVQRWNDNLAERQALGAAGRLPQSQGTTDLISFWQMDVNNNAATFDLSGELMQFDNSSVMPSMSFGFPAYNWLPSHTDASSYVYARYGRNYCDCRPTNQVQVQAGTGAFYNSYEKYAADIKSIGQDYSIVPDFTISDYVRNVITNYDGDFYQDIYRLKMTGAYGTRTTQSVDLRGTLTSEVPYTDGEFFEKLSHTDIVTHLGELKGELGEPDSISIKMSGILKLLPVDGFYPAQRTIQLAKEFKESYFSGSEGRLSSKSAWRTALRPFYNPGIMYNTIKTGVAVDYPIIDEESDSNRVATSSNTAEYTKRLPFEAIIEPSTYTRKIKGPSSLVEPQDLRLFDWDPDQGMTRTYSASLGGTDGVYEKASHNFFAESVNFFVSDLTNLSSTPEEEWSFKEQKVGKIWTMDVVVDKSTNFTMHDAVGYFGHKPYKHHTPAWYPLKTGTSYTNDGSNNWWMYVTGNVAACSGTVKIPPSAAHAKNSAIATIKFDPTNIYNMDPEKFFSGKFTFEDIVANSTLSFKNQDRTDQYTVFGISSGGMALSASLNLFQKDKEKRWTISTKYETPILNFANVDALATKAGGSSSFTGNGSTGGDPYRGMWHQYGLQCTGSEGLWLRVADSQLTIAQKSMTGSLLDACGFSNEKKKIGQIKPQKELREAVVAIPFYYDEDDKEQFFDLPLEQFEQAYSDIAQATAAQSTVKKKGEEYVLTVENSIADMIFKMRRYNLIPQYDFVRVRDKATTPLNSKKQYEPAMAPFAMYIFEFSNILSKTDLQKMWQGVLPEIGKTAQKQEITLSHELKDGELLSKSVFEEQGLEGGKIPEDIRWKIFKIKRRAANNYFEMLEQKLNLPENVAKSRGKLLSAEYGANWPYDYCSLVEFGKLETSFDFNREEKEKKEEERIEEERTEELVLIDDSISQRDREGLANTIREKRSSTTATIMASSTGRPVPHSHEIRIDASGHGIALLKCSPESDRVCHEHEIVDFRVVEAQSDCYPECREYYGTTGIAPHTHEITLSEENIDQGSLAIENPRRLRPTIRREEIAVALERPVSPSSRPAQPPARQRATDSVQPSRRPTEPLPARQAPPAAREQTPPTERTTRDTEDGGRGGNDGGRGRY